VADEAREGDPTMEPNFLKLLVLFLIIALIFGAKRLPEIGRGMGKGIREFRDATKGLHDDVRSGMNESGNPQAYQQPQQPQQPAAPAAPVAPAPPPPPPAE
jgi:sec-independent protein translocase protein TatA